MCVPALVSVQWLNKQSLSSPKDLIILDGSLAMPGEKRDTRNDFEKSRIFGAKFFDIEECSDKTTPYEHMMPTAEEFASFVNKLGVRRATHVVVYDNNVKFGMFSAPRVWWTFRVFGHERVSVLDGGLPRWLAEGYPTESGPVQNAPVEVVGEPFEAVFNKDMLVDFEFIKSNALKSSRIQHIDARSKGRFLGTAPEPRPGIPSGHIPNSKSFPFTLCLNPETKLLKDPEDLKKIFQEAGIDLSQPLITSCGSGVTGSLLGFATYLTGKEDTKLYDGSWTEWALRAPPEMMLKGEK